MSDNRVRGGKGADGLTEKQRAFAEAYLSNGRCAAAAYRAAYNPDAGPGIARQEGYKVLHRSAVARVVAEADRRAQAATAKVMDRYAVTKERIALEFARIAFGDLRDIFDESGNLLRPSELDDDAAARIASIEVVARSVPGGERGEVEYVHKIKAWDKVAALTQLGRTLGMFTDNVGVRGNIAVTFAEPGDADL